MLEDVEFNWWAILAAALLPMVVGIAWYRVLAGPWMRAVGKSPEDVGRAGPLYAVALGAAFVMSYVLARVVDWAGAESFGDALIVGVVVWVGFVATTMLVNGIFAGRPSRLWAIDGGYHLVSLLGMSLVLTLWD